MTSSGLPANFLRNAGSCVAIPTGQVFRWHLRIMMHPIATNGAVENPNSSAPRRAAIATSRPVFSFPSVCTVMRGRNQPHARNRITDPRDDLVHFVAGKLAALAGLRTLRDFDLQIVGVDQVIGCHTEASGCHLLDGAAAPVAVGVALETLFIL